MSETETTEAEEYSAIPADGGEVPADDPGQLDRIEDKVDQIGLMLNGIVLTVSNAEKAIMSGPMGRMIAGKAAANGRQA